MRWGPLQDVIDWLYGPLDMLRRTWPSFLAIAVLGVSAAVVFKVHHPEITWIDSAYAAMSTITTLGDFEIEKKPQSEKVILLIIVLLAVGVAATAIQEIVSIFAQRELWIETMTRRRVARMEKHVIVVGSGPCPREIVKKLRALLLEHVVVAADRVPEGDIEALEPSKVLQGDLRRHATLLEAGIERASQVEIALDDDALALVVTMNARQLSSTARIVVNVDDEELTQHFRTAGANVVIGSSKVIGRIMAVAGITEHVSGTIFSDVAGLQKEIGVFRIAATSRAANKTIERSAIHEHAWILGVVRGGSFHWEMNRDSMILPGDELVVLGDAVSFLKLRELTKPA